MIDDVEVGRPVSTKIRLAFEVHDSAATTNDLVAAGFGTAVERDQSP